MQRGRPAATHSPLLQLMCLPQLSLVLVHGKPRRQVRNCSPYLKEVSALFAKRQTASPYVECAASCMFFPADGYRIGHTE